MGSKNALRWARGVLATLNLISFGGASSVQAQSATTICDLPGYRGTAIYNRYCGGQSRADPVGTEAPTYDPARSFKISAANVIGEFKVVKKNGRVFTQADLATVPLEFGDVMLTGPTGNSKFLLPDATAFSLGPNSEIEVDSFIYDPDTGKIDEMLIGVVKGTLRFVTGKIAPRIRSEPRVKIAVGILGIRGTDIEFEQSPDGAGSIKLYSGHAELTPYDSETVIDISAGQMVKWTDFTKMSGPMPIE